MTHIFFKSHGEVPGYIQVVGMYLNYNYGRIADEYNDMRVELNKLGATVISEEVAKGFVFANIYKDYISVRTNSHIMDEIPQFAESSETEAEKVKYFLTDEDRSVGVEFNKMAMKKVVADRFSERYKELMLDASTLEKDTWEEQKREAFGWMADEDYQTPIIDILCVGRNIDKATFVQKIITNVTAYNVKLANLLLEQQLLEERIKACETIADCHRLKHEKFGIALSKQQREDENIPTTPLTLKMDF
jgi:adenylate kinase family enzyme